MEHLLINDRGKPQFIKIKKTSNQMSQETEVYQLSKKLGKITINEDDLWYFDVDYYLGY